MNEIQNPPKLWAKKIREALEAKADLQKQVAQISKLVFLQDDWGENFSESSLEFVICQIKGGSASMCSGYENADEVKEIWKQLKKLE